MGALLNVAAITYQNYENGLRTFPEDVLNKACSILKLEIRQINSQPISIESPEYKLALMIFSLSEEKKKTVEDLVGYLVKEQDENK